MGCVNSLTQFQVTHQGKNRQHEKNQSEREQNKDHTPYTCMVYHNGASHLCDKKMVGRQGFSVAVLYKHADKRYNILFELPSAGPPILPEWPTGQVFSVGCTSDSLFLLCF